jgi:hypothetical protein
MLWKVSARRLSPTDQLLALCQPVKAVGKMLLRRPHRRPASGNRRLGSGDFGFDLFPLRAECFARGKSVLWSDVGCSRTGETTEVKKVPLNQDITPSSSPSHQG